MYAAPKKEAIDMVAGHLQEKKGYYYIVLNLIDENGKRKPKWIPTGLPTKGNKRKAEALLSEERRKHDKACTTSVRSDILFSEYMKYWLGVIKADVEETTYAGYDRNVRRIIVPYFEERQILLSDLQPIDIQNFYINCRKERGVSNNTVIHYHSNLSKALKYAAKMNMIKSNPMLQVERPKPKTHIGQYYTLAEIENLISLVQGDPIEFPVLMAAFYGLRRSEIIGLRWKAVDFENNLITIEHTVVQTDIDGATAIVKKDRAKNKSSYRSLPLVPQYKALLVQMKEYQEECKMLCGHSYTDSDYIYVNDIGQLYKPDYVTGHFRYFLKSHGLRKITFHELRHSCASLLLKSGVSMKDIQAWLGHSTYNTTANIYAHLDSSSKNQTGSVMASKLDISAIVGSTPPQQSTRGCL
jgi:Site-specific recombinase XerD